MDICIRTGVKALATQDMFINLLLLWKGDRCACNVLSNQPGDYPSVKGQQQQQSWQATGLARDAIKASTGNLCLTHTDRIVAAPSHIHTLCSNCEVEGSPWVTSDDFAISWLLAITYCIHSCKPIITCKLIKLVSDYLRNNTLKNDND